MSAVTQTRYREARVNAFRKVLVRWLSKLPADGWKGGVEELGEALWAITRRDPVPTYIPFGTGLGRVIAAEQPFIAACGFTVEYRRTKHARTLRFTRTG
jgi:hypothetical protein